MLDSGCRLGQAKHRPNTPNCGARWVFPRPSPGEDPTYGPSRLGSDPQGLTPSQARQEGVVDAEVVDQAGPAQPSGYKDPQRALGAGRCGPQGLGVAHLE